MFYAGDVLHSGNTLYSDVCSADPRADVRGRGWGNKVLPDSGFFEVERSTGKSSSQDLFMVYTGLFLQKLYTVELQWLEHVWDHEN